jgi:hypothetical protein
MLEDLHRRLNPDHWTPGSSVQMCLPTSVLLQNCDNIIKRVPLIREYSGIQIEKFRNKNRRKECNEELRNLYFWPDIVGVIVRMSRAGQVAQTVEMRNACNISVGKPKKKEFAPETCIDGRIILKLMLSIVRGDGMNESCSG